MGKRRLSRAHGTSFNEVFGLAKKCVGLAQNYAGCPGGLVDSGWAGAVFWTGMNSGIGKFWHV